MYNSVNKIKTNEYVKRLYGSCKTYNFWWWEFFADTVRDSENALTSHAQWRILPQVILYNNGVAPVHAVCPACMCVVCAVRGISQKLHLAAFPAKFNLIFFPFFLVSLNNGTFEKNFLQIFVATTVREVGRIMILLQRRGL